MFPYIHRLSSLFNRFLSDEGFQRAPPQFHTDRRRRSNMRTVCGKKGRKRHRRSGIRTVCDTPPPGCNRSGTIRNGTKCQMSANSLPGIIRNTLRYTAGCHKQQEYQHLPDIRPAVPGSCTSSSHIRRTRPPA